MNKKWMAAALGAVAMLGMTACSSADDPDATASGSPEATLAPDGGQVSPEEAAAADQETLDQITWVDGDPGATLEFEGPLTMTGSAGKVIADGDGEEIADGQNVTLHYSSYSGADASQLGSTYTNDTPETVSLIEGAVDPPCPTC